MSTFDFVEDIGSRGPTANLEDNLKSFLDWSFLNIGGFININIPPSGSPATQQSLHKLRPSTETGYSPGRVWETARKDWVYETGVVHNNISPIPISGIYVNQTFLPAPTGNSQYSYTLDYPLGRIIFNNNINTNSQIELNYSSRYIQVYKSNESVWWKTLENIFYNPSNSKANNIKDITSVHRIEMPAIMIESTPRVVLTPHELGTRANIITQDVLLHIFTNNPVQRDNIISILLLQKDKSLRLYDINKVVKAKVNPVDNLGQPNPNRLNYDQLINDILYRANYFNIRNISISELNTITSSLYNGILRLSLEIFP
jgi:hypothetical protein